MAQISPTLLCADPLNLERDLRELETLPFCWHHIDIMDGHFVPNLAFGMQMVEAIRRLAKLPLAAHLMTEDPGRWLDKLSAASVDWVVFHIEATTVPLRLASEIRRKGMRPGIALNPATPVSQLEDIVGYFDLVLLMGVEPGFSGQAFLKETVKKIRRVRELIQAGGHKAIIEVDGGVDEPLARACVQAGADVIVGGLFTVFKEGHTITQNTHSLQAAIAPGKEDTP